MSSFPFIQEKILKDNLDQAVEFVIELIALSEAEQYKDRELLVSSLRKTIIVNTAAIIEALLHWKLELTSQEKVITLSDDWNYFEIKVIHELSEAEQIIAGKRKKEKKSLKRLDFLRIIDYCFKTGIIPSKLKDELNQVRLLRNRLHLAGLDGLDKSYRRQDLQFCFSVLEKVQKAVE